MASLEIWSWGPGILAVRVAKWFWRKNKPLAVTAVVVFGAIKISKYIKRQNLRKKWNNAGKDVVVLHIFQRGKFSPSVSPYVVKLETYLRMAGIPYQIDFEEPLGPKRKCPWITLNGEAIGDSQLIVERLGEQLGKDFSAHLTKEQQAAAHAMRVMTDEHLVLPLAYWRFITTRGKPFMKTMELPFYYQFFIGLTQRKVKQLVMIQGIGRHKTSEIEEMGRKDLQALSDYLGEKPYLMGDKATEVDCAVFGMLSQIVWNSPGSPYLRMVDTEFPNLHQYCQRVKERFWPDWNKCLYPPQ